MGEFTNMEMHLEPETTLYQQEVDVVMAVIDRVLSNSVIKKYPTKGTFILDGQKMGKKAYNIIRFNFQNGYSTHQLCGKNSDEMAEKSIDEILSYPSPESYYYFRSDSENFGLLPSGWYRHKNGEPLRAMVINASFGRFIASFYDGAYGSEIECLSAIAETLAQLGKEDKVLRRSVNDIMAERDKEIDFNSVAAVGMVEHMFETCEHPTLKAWKEWHDSAIAANELKYFFE